MKQTYGAYIKKLRAVQDLSQSELARECGFSSSFLSQMENGIVSPPGEEKIKRMAEVLNQDSDELLALCGKVSSDLVDIILKSPTEMAAMIRRQSHTSSRSKKQNLTLQTEDPLEFLPLEQIALESHTAVIGATNSGKTTFTQHLIEKYFKKAQIQVYDSDASPKDWYPLKVRGRKGNYAEIAQEMLNDLQELQHRTELRGDGVHVGGEIVRVVEEWPTTSADINELKLEGMPSDMSSRWLRRLLRRGRKYRMKVFAVAQEFEVNAWQIAGEGGLRDNFTVLYLGAKVYKALSGVKDKSLNTQLRKHFESVEYPCLANVKGLYYPVEIPKLGKKKK